MNAFKRVTVFLIAFLIVIGFMFINNPPVKQTFTEAKAENNSSDLRGIWVASVFSLDFPVKTTIDSDELKLELDRIVNNASEMGFNAIFFQVRPACDALYNSAIFPTSKYLTGTQGVAPNDNFDPLSYITDKAHAKGIQLHAWINPYRVTASKDEENTLSSNNPVKLNEKLAIKHTDGKLYLNPALSEVRQLIVDGAVEIVKNYDVDGIHLDDYFYPAGGLADEEYFASQGSGYSNIDDWRRDNVTALIKELKTAIKSAKPNVQFGVSPAGIWANSSDMEGGSDTSGSQTYFRQYADTKKWVKEELVDYIAPQIYWERSLKSASFDVLTKWWSDTVKGTNVKLYIGLAAYKADETDDTSSAWYGINGINELNAQLDICSSLENINGYIAYRYKNAIYNPQLYRLFEIKNMGSFGDTGAVENESSLVPTQTPVPTSTPTAAPTPSPVQSENNEEYRQFEDMKGYEWAESAVKSLVKSGVIKGVSDTEFMPSMKIKRADYTLMITRMFDGRAEFSENFADVTKNKYYYNEIGVARKLGFAQGMGENMFYPENSISRQDMAVMAYRILKEKGYITELSESAAFKDYDTVSDYAKDAILALNYLGVLNGDTNGNVRPRDMASRADTAVFINNIRTVLSGI